MIETHLDEIGRACGTDKHGLHHYLEFYHELLRPLRHRKINMLEIGVLGGNSLCMWDAFFSHPGTRIWGADIHDRWNPPPASRINIRIGNASEAPFINQLVSETGPFDLIIDDGSHFSREQKETFHLLWPHVKPGGIFLVEDTHSSYHYPWTDNGEESFVCSLMNHIHRVNEYGKDECGVPSECDIEEIVIRKSVVVFKKNSKVW